MLPVQRRSLVDQVTSRLLDAIGSGDYPIGGLLPAEPYLAAQFNVSRTVLREAVAQLRVEGVVDTVQGRGTYVSSRQPARIALKLSDEFATNLLRIVELRRGLEGEAAMLAAQRRQDGHVRTMRDLLTRMDDCLQRQDLAGVVEADIGFHREIFIASGNKHLLNLYDHVINLVKDNITESRRNSFELGKDPRPIQQEHAAILAAIARADGELALMAARRHMQETAHRLGERLSSGEENAKASTSAGDSSDG